LIKTPQRYTVQEGDATMPPIAKNIWTILYLKLQATAIVAVVPQPTFRVCHQGCCLLIVGLLMPVEGFLLLLLPFLLLLLHLLLLLLRFLLLLLLTSLLHVRLLLLLMHLFVLLTGLLPELSGLQPLLTGVGLLLSWLLTALYWGCLLCGVAFFLHDGFSFSLLAKNGGKFG
jgi:hypothetical protein